MLRTEKLIIDRKTYILSVQSTFLKIKINSDVLDLKANITKIYITEIYEIIFLL